MGWGAASLPASVQEGSDDTVSPARPCGAQISGAENRGTCLYLCAIPVECFLKAPQGSALECSPWTPQDQANGSHSPAG